MENLMRQFSHIPPELIISFPSEFAFQSMLQRNFNYNTLTTHMMQNQTDYMKAYMNSITSQFNYRVENKNKNKTGSKHSNSPLYMHGNRNYTPKKRFQCDFADCKKEFSLFKDLKRHWVVHTGSRQFKCSYCNSLFGRNDHKIRHENKCRVASNYNINIDQSQSQTINGDDDKGIANPYHLDTNQNPFKPIKALPINDRKYQPSAMEDGCRTPDNQNASSPSSTASGSTSSVRDMAKMLAMSVFSRGKKRKHNQIKDGGVDDASTNSDDSLSAPISKSKRVVLPSEVRSAPVVKEKISVVPISRISANNSLKTNLANPLPERAQGKEVPNVGAIESRNSPILKNLLFTSTSISAPSTSLSSTNTSKSPLSSSSTPPSISVTNTSTKRANKDPNLLKTLLAPKAIPELQENTERIQNQNASRPVPSTSTAKNPESVSLKFLCCFSTLVLKPPAPGDVRRSSKTDEQYVSYVCYAFDKGTLMCNQGAPTENVKHILSFARKTGGKIPCTFLYNDSSMQRRSYNRFVIKGLGWDVNVRKPGTARDVLHTIRKHEAFFLPDQGLSKVMSYVKQNYNSALIKETIPMIEGEAMANAQISNSGTHDLLKIGEGKDFNLLLSCSVKNKPGNGISNPITRLPVSLPLNLNSNPIIGNSLQPPPPPHSTQNLTLTTQVPSQSSIQTAENIKITVLPDQNRAGMSETLILPSMGNATITLHSASSEVVDTTFTSGGQPSMSTGVNFNTSNSNRKINSPRNNTLSMVSYSSSSSNTNSDVKPEEVPITDAQYPLLNEEQLKKVTSCSTCGVSFSLIAEKLLHYTENLVCMKVITEKYKFFQPENNFYSIVAADIEQTARSNPEAMPSSYPCSACDSVTKKSIFGYCWHRDRHRPFTVRIFVCSICTAIFRTPYNYVNHSCFSQSSSNKTTLRDEPLSINEKLPENGNVANNQQLSDNSEFAMYSQLSAQTRNFYLKCPIETCGKKFIYISGLLGHLRTHQSCLLTLIANVSPIELETGKVTLNDLLISYSRRKKEEQVPSEAGPFPCETCTELSKSPLAYMLHRDHHKLKDNESRLLCKVCDELFVTPCAFYNHNCASKANKKKGYIQNKSNITWCIFCARLENLPKLSKKSRNVQNLNQTQQQKEVDSQQLQPNEDDCTSDLQIVSVCSLSSVMNCFPITGEGAANSATPYNRPNSAEKTKFAPGKKALQAQSEDKTSKTSVPVTSTSTSSPSLNDPRPSISTSKNAQESKKASKPVEGVKLKITNLNSKTPCVSSLTTSSSKTSLPKESSLTKGRIKVKSFKELMAKPTNKLSMSENVTSTSLADNKSHENVSEDNMSDLKISNSFSISAQNEQNNSEGVEEMHTSGKENDHSVTVEQEKSNNNEERRTIGEEEEEKHNRDDKTKAIFRDDTMTEEKGAKEISKQDIKVKKEESLDRFKEEEEKYFDKDDCYVCMDCQPLKLLNGLGLTRHCINNPTHFQINHLADFNKFDIPISKLPKTTVDRYFNRLSNRRKKPISLTSQSSIDSSSSDYCSDSSTVQRSRRKRKNATKRYFESSDTATDDDLSQKNIKVSKAFKSA